MSRSKKFFTGLISSYAAIGVNILYTIGSVPLALHYLNNEQFGLWALVTQMSCYLGLIELGMRGSVSRILSDYKDDKNGGEYGSVLRTGNIVFLIQGLVMALCGVFLALSGPHLLDLPSKLHNSFTVFMIIQSSLGGAGLALAGFTSPLWCHQRLDISALISSISLVVSFALLWFGFSAGFGIYSMLSISVAGLVVGSSLGYICCKRLGFYPADGHRGQYDHRIFKELIGYGSSLFLMNLGSQLASASQVILISRIMGVESAAVWAISTKIYTMAHQFVAKVLDASVGGLTEMLVRGNQNGMRDKFIDIVAISSIAAAVAGGGIILMNGPFVELWTEGKISWHPWNNMLLGCALFFVSVTRCHTGLVGVTKHIQGMKYINLVEGVFFVLLSLMLIPRMGFTGALLATLICNIGIAGAYAISRTSDYFHIPVYRVVAWGARPMLMLGLVLLCFALGQLLPVQHGNARLRLIVGAAIFAITFPVCLLTFGLKANLRLQFVSLLISSIAKIRNRRRAA